MSFESLCCRNLSTSTYDESVLIGVTAGGVEVEVEVGDEVFSEVEDNLRGTILGGTISIFFFTLATLGLYASRSSETLA